MGSTLCCSVTNDYTTDLPQKFDAEKYLGTWYELRVPLGKNKGAPIMTTKLVLRKGGMAELSRSDGSTSKFDYRVIDTDYATHAIITSKTNEMVSVMFGHQVQFQWVLSRAPLRPGSTEWNKVHRTTNNVLGSKALENVLKRSLS